MKCSDSEDTEHNYFSIFNEAMHAVTFIQWTFSVRRGSNLFSFFKYIFDPHNFLSAGDISMEFLIPVWASVSWMCQILTDVISVA